MLRKKTLHGPKINFYYFSLHGDKKKSKGLEQITKSVISYYTWLRICSDISSHGKHYVRRLLCAVI